MSSEPPDTPTPDRGHVTTQYKRKEDTRNCPHCGEATLIDTPICIHCGQRTGDSVRLPPGPFSFAQPPRNFLILSIVTFNLYTFYWYYKTWKKLAAHHLLHISPGWRTVGLLVPLLNIYLIYSLMRDVRDYGDLDNIAMGYSPGLLLLAFMLASVLGGLPMPYGILGLTSCFPFAIVQSGLNAYWKEHQPEHIMRLDFSAGEKTVIIIGGAVWVVTLITLFVQPDLAP